MSCNSLKQSLDPENAYPNCFTNSNVAEENRKRFVINKPANISVCKVKVDGCLITSQQVRKCDFFFEVSTDPKQYYLVELKGSDLNSAVDQVVSTYDQLKPKLTAQPQQFVAAIVSSSVPSQADAAFRQQKERILKSRRLALERKTTHFIVDIRRNLPNHT